MIDRAIRTQIFVLLIINTLSLFFGSIVWNHFYHVVNFVFIFQLRREETLTPSLRKLLSGRGWKSEDWGGRPSAQSWVQGLTSDPAPPLSPASARSLRSLGSARSHQRPLGRRGRTQIRRHLRSSGSSSQTVCKNIIALIDRNRWRNLQFGNYI